MLCICWHGLATILFRLTWWSESAGMRQYVNSLRWVNLGAHLDSDYEIVEPPLKQFQNECPICLLIFREPRLVDCYGYSFCGSCIGHIETGKPCPARSVRGRSLTSLCNLRSALNDFASTDTIYFAAGIVSGPVNEMVDEHVNYDPKPQQQLEGRQFAP